ncbi:ribonuclease Z [candidate division KSB1 bacterium]|nr:ribonuclease Z [candidate division KSB1 bacterium]
MSERVFVALGTASQVPTRWRNHSGYFLRWDDEGILFDPGEGTQRQMIGAGVSVSEITRIFISHFHGDHCLGLAGIIQRLSLDNVQHPVHVYYPASGQQYYDNLRHAAIFHDTTILIDHPISESGKIFENDKFMLETKLLDHSVETWGLRLQERDDVTFIPEKLAAFGISGPDIRLLRAQGWIDLADGRRVELTDVSNPRFGQSFAFVIDTRLCPAANELADNVDMLVCEATFLSDRSAEAARYGHMTASDAASLARASGADLLILTHFSQRYPSTAPFLEEAAAIHANVIAVRDGERVPIPHRQRVITSL